MLPFFWTRRRPLLLSLLVLLLLAGCAPVETTPTPPAGLPGVGTLDDILAQQEPLPEPAGPAGFGVAWATFSALIIGLVAGCVALWRQRPWRQQPQWSEWSSSPPTIHWLVPLLALAGLGVSIYLAYVETNETVTAICGPVGNCNAVQDSPYAVFLGVPVAVWGLVNYVALMGMWAGQLWGHGRLRWLSRLGLVALTLPGVVFSLYLTALELFVIEAVCMWCISSAVITVALFVLSVALTTPSREPLTILK